MRRTRSARSTLRIWLLLASCVLSACLTASPRIATPTELPSPLLATGMAGPPSRSGPPIARFTLVLTADPTDTRGFELYLSTDPASSGPTAWPLCAQAPAPPCDVAHSRFCRVFRDLRPGTHIVFRIERLASVGSIVILLQGSELFGQGEPEQRATYP
jgi:hypothetical protein